MSMHLSIVVIRGKTYGLSINGDAYVYDIKVKMHETIGFCPNHQRLVFKGYVMNDCQSLESYGVKERSKLFLSIAPAEFDSSNLRSRSSSYNNIVEHTMGHVEPPRQSRSTMPLDYSIEDLRFSKLDTQPNAFIKAVARYNAIVEEHERQEEQNPHFIPCMFHQTVIPSPANAPSTEPLPPIINLNWDFKFIPVCGQGRIKEPDPTPDLVTIDYATETLGLYSPPINV